MKRMGIGIYPVPVRYLWELCHFTNTDAITVENTLMLYRSSPMNP
jgi:hypothetical protein